MKIDKIKDEVKFNLENLKNFLRENPEEVFPTVVSEGKEDKCLLDVFFDGDIRKTRSLTKKLKEWSNQKEIGRIKIGKQYYYQLLDVIEDIKKSMKV